MNIHHLELFYYVAFHRGVTAAARRMPYSVQQPAISAQIGQLERSLGLRLFQRRPFKLTTAGVRLFQEIAPFFGRLPDLQTRVRGDRAPRLRIAAPARILRDYLPPLLAKYKRQVSGLEVSLHDVNQAAAEELLIEQRVDLAITELERRAAPPLNAFELLRLPLALLAPARSRFRKIADFFKKGRPVERLVSLSPHEVITKQFHAGLAKLGWIWEPTIDVNSLDLIEIYTSLGFGVGTSVMLPGRKLPKGYRLLRLREFRPLTIAALWNDELPRVAQSFLADVKILAGQIKLRGRHQFGGL